jgi:hypothetical protein
MIWRLIKLIWVVKMLLGAILWWFFLLCVYISRYFRRLREKDLVGKISVREVLFEFSKMEMIVEQSG